MIIKKIIVEDTEVSIARAEALEMGAMVYGWVKSEEGTHVVFFSEKNGTLVVECQDQNLSLQASINEAISKLPQERIEKVKNEIAAVYDAASNFLAYDHY